MQRRTFEDRTGVVWSIWEIPAEPPNADKERERRHQPRAALRPSPREKRLATRPHAWLYFESQSERRRVSSVPNRWEHLDDGALEDLLAHSRPLSRQDSLDRNATLSPEVT